MNTFDQRWKTAAGQARREAAEPVPPLPLGFVTRVLARSRDVSEISWYEMLTALSLRALIVTSALCLLSGGYAWSQWYEPRLAMPELESSFTTEITWP